VHADPAGHAGGVVVGILEAAVAMVLYSAAALMQAAGAQKATRRRPVAVQPGYLGGLGVDLLAWMFAVLALQRLPVFAVQAVIGGSIAVTALFNARTLGVRLPATSRLGVVGCLVGLVLVASSAGDDRAQPVPSRGVDLVLLVAILLLGVATLVLRHGTRAWPLALVAGMGFGGSALAIRAAHVQAGSALDPTLLLHQPSTYLVLGFAAVGLVGYTTALSRGDIGAVTAVFMVTEVLVPGMVGIALLGDPVRDGAVWGWLLVLGLAAALAGTVLLAKAPSLRTRASRVECRDQVLERGAVVLERGEVRTHRPVRGDLRDPAASRSSTSEPRSSEDST
jgi:drug/metabolite transporter (DMT)-like permease